MVELFADHARRRDLRSLNDLIERGLASYGPGGLSFPQPDHPDVVKFVNRLPIEAA